MKVSDIYTAMRQRNLCSSRRGWSRAWLRGMAQNYATSNWDRELRPEPGLKLYRSLRAYGADDLADWVLESVIAYQAEPRPKRLRR